jgi:hypothetical protein
MTRNDKDDDKPRDVPYSRGLSESNDQKTPKNTGADEAVFSRAREVPPYKVRAQEREDKALRLKEIEAAKAGASASRKSARWAAWAVVVSIAALAVAAWQQVN